MNRWLLDWTAKNLQDWLRKSTQETVSADKKLDLIMFSLVDICKAMADEKDTAPDPEDCP